MTLPAVRRALLVTLDAASTESVAVVRGSTTVTLSPGSGLVLYVDGTPDGLAAIERGVLAASIASLTDGPGAPAGSSSSYLMVNPAGTAVQYVPALLAGSARVETAPTASEVLIDIDLPCAARCATNLAGWSVRTTTAATAATVYSVQRNGVQVGTITIAAGSTTATLAGSQTDFAAGDRLSVVAPASPDATHARFTITFTLTRRG